MIKEDDDFSEYYALQNVMKEKVVKEDDLPKVVRYIAGVDVAYNEEKQQMVGAIVVLDAITLKVVEKQHHIMPITFPYVPGLFSFREIPAIKEAYGKLLIKPNIIVCDAQGIAHPKGVGMATHLGIELDIATIGCAKKRLVGTYEKENVGKEKGAFEFLKIEGDTVGVVLRTQTNIKPMFVSVGHKIGIETAIEWVSKLTPNYRLPETTREADHLVNKINKDL